MWKDWGRLKEAGNKAEIKGGVESRGWAVNVDYADDDDGDDGDMSRSLSSSSSSLW